MRRRNGFTLIELLVVVAIIATLAAILMPIYTTAKASAKRSACQSNLSQISRGFEAYLADNNSCYPNTNEFDLWQGRLWRWSVEKYVGFYAAYNASDANGKKQTTKVSNNVLACPKDTTDIAQFDKTSYAYSASFYHTPDQINSINDYKQLITKLLSPDCAVVMTSNVRWPAKKVMIAEWQCNHSDPTATFWSWNGSRNYLFADGHVIYLSASKIHPANDRNSSGNTCPDINATKDGVAGKDID